MHPSRHFAGVLFSVGLLLGGLAFAWAAEPPLDPRPEKRIGARGTAPPGLVFDEPHVRFADLYQLGEISHLFPFRNSGSKPVLIEQAFSVAGSGRVEAVPRVVPPGGTGEIRVTQPIESQLGEAAFRYALITDEPGVARYRFSLSGFVESAYDPEKPQLAFGQVDRARGGQLEIEVSSREVPRLEILEMVGLPPWLELKVAGRAGEDQQGVRLLAKLVDRPPLGWQHAEIRLRTNVANQRFCLVQLAALIYDDLVPSVNPVSFGATVLGGTYLEKIELRSRRGQPLTGLAVEDPARWVRTRILPCPQAADDPSCRQLELELPVAPLAAAGPFTGKVEIRLGQGAEVLPVIYSGIVSPPGTPIRQLEVPADAYGGSPVPPGGGR